MGKQNVVYTEYVEEINMIYVGYSSMVQKHVLPNGLTILVVSQHHNPQVSIQLWYGVGSKYERSGQKGIAHLIEHMIFKGTSTLSESDINQITQKLSGECNAFTSHDYTGYLFDFPSQNWHHALPIMADCMRNCTFREEFLHSELKAVVQELKMYRDQHISTLIERMMGSIFMDHPYRYPVIGYKHDLWSLSRDALVEFYEHHYVPNNAALVVVGDVTASEVFDRAGELFGGIAANPDYKRPELFHSPELISTNTVFMSHVEQKQGVIGWEIPGVCVGKNYESDIASWILGSGKGSRLYRRIVEELDLATDIDTMVYDLFDQGLFFVTYQPKDDVPTERIVAAITQEIDAIGRDGFAEHEFDRAIRKAKMDLVSLQEQPQQLAYEIGKLYLATGDADAVERYAARAEDPSLQDDVRQFMSTFLRPAVAHEGLVVPIVEREKPFWLAQQEQSDAEDHRILSRITRDAPVEQGVHVLTIEPEPLRPFAFPRATRVTLSNGLTVLFAHMPHVPTIDLLLDFPAKHYYDPENRQGLNMFLMNMLQEGTEKYSSVQFAQELEAYGMSLSASPGLISLKMLSDDFEHGVALLAEMIQRPLLHQHSVEKLRYRIIADVREFWDTPAKYISQMMRDVVYGAHPYHRSAVGTVESMRAITHEDVVSAYKQWITPHGATIAVVGDLRQLDIPAILERHLGSWEGNPQATIEFPSLSADAIPEHIAQSRARDQVTVAFGRLSVARTDAAFTPLLLFDQIFTGGSRISMSSRLFELRERSGLFYTIGGSIVAGAGYQPGMAYIRTIVSPDRLDEAMHAIAGVIDDGARGLTDQELDEAQRSVATTIIETFSTNRQAAGAFLFLEEYKLQADYFENRIAEIQSISRKTVQEASDQLLRADTFSTIKIGRL